MRQHAGALLVAAAIVAAALAEGLFEPSAYAAASIVIWAAVIAGLVGRALPTAPVAATAAGAGLCLAAVILLAGASVGWASDQGRAFDEAVRAFAYLGVFVLAACTAGREGRGQWLAGLAGGLGVVSVLALLSHLQPGLLSGDDLEALIPGAAGRASYPIGYWNGLAALLATAAVLLAHGGARAPERWMRSSAIAVMPLALLGIWLTSSRGGAAAVVLGLAVLLAASGERRRLLPPVAVGVFAGAVLIVAAELIGGLGSPAVDAARRAGGDRMSAIALLVALLAGATGWMLDGRSSRLRLSRRGALLLAGLVAVVAVAALAVADPAERFRDFKRPPSSTAAQDAAVDDFSSSGRWQFWGEAIDAFESAPAAGIGAGAYEDWWARNATVAVFVRNPHSLPLQQAAELGVIGLLALLGFAAAVALAARRRLATGRDGDSGPLIALLVTAGASALVDWTWAIPAVVAPAVIAAALLTASAPGPRLKRGGYWLGLGTLVLAWLAVVAGGLVVLTELKLEQSRAAAAEGRIEDGIGLALEARTVQPWSPEPYTQLALLEEAQGDFEQALLRLRQAEEHDSEDWRLAVIEARLHLGRGDEPAAGIALERAALLNRLSPEVGGGSGTEG